MDEGWEGWLKVSLSLLQMLTGIPAYTAAEQTEKDITQLKEAAARFMEKLPKTPEELQNRIEEAVTRACWETEAVKTVLERLAALTPEDWETILRNTLNRLEEQAKASCTEENMEELCYDAGYAEGTVIGILLEELFEFALGAELSTWITKGADAADTAGDLAKLGIGELPDAGDVRKIKDAAEGVIGEAAEEVVEKNLDDVAEVAIEGGSESNKYISRLGRMSEEDAIRYDGYWKYQEALERGQFKNGSIYDGWYKPDGSMNYPDNSGAIPGTEEMVTLGSNSVIQVGRYGIPTDTSAYVTEVGVSADRLALPPNTNPNEYIKYKINGSIDNVERAVVAPWVGDRGLGIQYKLPKPIQWYIEKGILILE